MKGVERGSVFVCVLCLSWFVSIGIVVSTNTYENVFQFIAIWFGFTDGGMKKLIGINYLIFVGWITKLPTIVYNKKCVGADLCRRKYRKVFMGAGGI